MILINVIFIFLLTYTTLLTSNIQVYNQTPNHADSEPNNTYLDAEYISKHTINSGNLTDIDWYNTTLDSGESLSVVILFDTAGTCNFNASLYQDDGTTPIGNVILGDYSAHLYLDSSSYYGDYYIKIDPISGWDTYEIHLDDIEDEDYEDDNDDYSSAPFIHENDVLNKMYLWDDDYFGVSLKPGWTLELTYSYVECGDVNFDVLMPDGITVANYISEKNLESSSLAEPFYNVILDDIPIDGNYYIHFNSSVGTISYDWEFSISGNPDYDGMTIMTV